jgi:hypothetical protein
MKFKIINELLISVKNSFYYILVNLPEFFFQKGINGAFQYIVIQTLFYLLIKSV